MKSNLLKYFLSIIIILTACDDLSDEIIDTASEPVTITSINVPNQIIYRDSPERLNVKLTVDNSASISEMWFKVRFYDGSFTIAPKVDMKDNGDIANNNDLQEGDNTYSGFTELTEENPRGIYTIEIFMDLIDGAQKKIAAINFNYENYVENIAPVISELAAPDTIIVEEPRSVFRMTLQASDENGQQDIKSVYFTTTRPDGTSNGAKLFLYDTGNFEEDGDEIEGDGIYSIIVQVTNENQKGEYTFDFQAEDRSNEKSNIISHKIVLM